MRNILYISLSILPSKYANSVHVMKMCAAMDRLGFNVTLVGMRERRVDVFEYFNVEEKFSLSLVSIPKIRLLRPLFYNFFCFKKIFKHDDIVFLRYMYPIIWVLLFRKSVIIEFHNIPKSKFNRFLISKVFKSKKFITAIFITHRLKKYYMDNFDLQDKKTIVLADCCDLPRVNFNDYKLKVDDIGYVGHLYEGRGVEIVIELARKFKDCKFHIIGGRDEDIEIFKRISPSNVIYYGFVKQSDLKDIYKNFSIVLAPYQLKVTSANKGDTAKWMSPMKIFEYMAYKKAIILSDLPALREIGEDKKHFLFVKPDRVEEWVKAIEILRNDKKLLESLISSSHAKFLEEYTWDKRVEKLSNLLKES